MTGTLFIDHAKVVTLTEVLVDSTVVVADGRVRAILPSGEAAAIPGSAGADHVDARDAILAPGFIDLHTHGLRENLVQKDPDQLKAMAKGLAGFGVTGWLPTVAPELPGVDAEYMGILAGTAAGQTPASGAQILGFHSEGPYLTQSGSLSPECLGKADPGRVRAMIAAAGPFQVIFSIAPDFEDVIPLIRIMRENGAPVFMTHTAANAKQTEAAIAAGACHATHFYDVFPAPPVTEDGVRPCGALEAIYAHPEVTVDFILDGVHVDPIAVKMALQCKGPDHVCLITDAMVGCGTLGEFEFSGSIAAFTEPGLPARIVGGIGTPDTLIGSGLTMNYAVRNAIRFGVADLPLAVRMGSANPARVLGLADRKGRIAEGYDADLVLLDDAFDPIWTWVAGVTVFQR